MVYGCGCAVVGKPNRFTTSAEMRFFWLPLSTMNCSGEPFTHIYVYGYLCVLLRSCLNPDQGEV